MAGRPLRFLTPPPNIRGAAVALLAAAVLAAAACESRTLGPQNGDSGTPAMCANVGCARAPLCGQTCQAPCGCCSCTPGDRVGDLVCLGGCYAPVMSDAGADAAATIDARGDGHVDGWIPPAACALPFDPGPCDAAIRVYAFVAGACVEHVYGGCQGNGNRFSTVEECMASCEGRPAAFPCPTGRVAHEICVACGPAGGCGKLIQVCALGCMAAASCPTTLPMCIGGVCQLGGCI